MPAVSYGYIPAQDAALEAWLTNFAAVITAAPASYGLTAGQATSMSTSAAAFATALAAAVNPATRTAVTVAAKDVQRASSVALARQLAAVAQGFPGITPALLSAAGLTVRQTVPSPVPAPTSSPILTVVANGGGLLAIGFADELTPSAKYKPFGAIGLQLVGVYSTVAPAGPDALPTLAQGGRWPIRVTAGTGNVGKTAYIWGRWTTRRGLVGPWSPLLTTIVQS